MQLWGVTQFILERLVCAHDLGSPLRLGVRGVQLLNSADPDPIRTNCFVKASYPDSKSSA